MILQRTTLNKKTKSGYYLNEKPAEDSDSQQKYTELEIVCHLVHFILFL